MGEFGNGSPTWDTLEEFERSSYSGMVHLRNRVPQGKTFYNIHSSNVALMAREAWNLGLMTPEATYFSAMAPHDYGTIQGELERRSDGGFYLTYNFQKLPMRDGFELERLHAYGVDVQVLLLSYLNQLSYDWMMTLLYRYPYHIIEFSSFGVDWGTVPGHNTLFWEVRLGY